jgi:hypothetical protein
MGFPTNPDGTTAARVRLIDELGKRLEVADRLTGTVRGALLRGDAESIESGCARLEALAAEFKVLVEEHRRLAAAGRDAAEGAEVAKARDTLRATVVRLSRSSAVSSGLLERMLTLRRGLLSLASAVAGGSYLPTGRSTEFEPQGTRLRQRA